MFSSYTLGSHIARIAYIEKLEGELLDQALTELHQVPLLAENGCRNVPASYVRACGISFGKLHDVVREDPLYKQIFHLVNGGSLVDENVLMNFFYCSNILSKKCLEILLSLGVFVAEQLFFSLVWQELLGSKEKFML